MILVPPDNLFTVLSHCNSANEPGNCTILQIFTINTRKKNDVFIQ